MPSEPVLSDLQRAFLEPARQAVLGTIAPDGRPRLVPICFVLDHDRPLLYTPIDDKPKRGDDPLALARVRDILADPTRDGARRPLGRGLDAARLAPVPWPGHRRAAIRRRRGAQGRRHRAPREVPRSTNAIVSSRAR